MQRCGLFVHVSSPWLAATLDGLVFDESQQGGQLDGCLEVKCPFSCKDISIEQASKSVHHFCLSSSEGAMELKQSHPYYYQVQAAMYVTQRSWCDFVVWSPFGPDLFVQRVRYNAQFCKDFMDTAQKFYCKKFPPTVVPYMLTPSTLPSESGQPLITPLIMP